MSDTDGDDRRLRIFLDDELTTLRAQLAEAQAREAVLVGIANQTLTAWDKLRDALSEGVPEHFLMLVNSCIGQTQEAIANTSEAAKAMGEERAVLLKCAEFVCWAMNEGPWDGCDLDGGGVQNKAEELELIVREPYDPEQHGDSAGSFELGDDIYVLSPALARLHAGRGA